MRVTGPPQERSHYRTCGEKATETSGNHVRQRGTEAAERSQQVDFHKLIPATVVEFIRGYGAGDSGVRHNDVKSRVRPHDVCDHTLDDGRLGHVSLDHQCSLALLLDITCHRRDVMAIVGVPRQRQIGSRLREQARGLGTDTRCGPGDERDAPIKPKDRALPCVACSYQRLPSRSAARSAAA
jgi:hypothetical protein